MRKVVFECGECRRTRVVWKEGGGAAPKRCEECRRDREKRLSQDRRHRKREKHKVFDRVVELFEAGGVEAVDEVLRVIEDWKTGGD